MNHKKNVRHKKYEDWRCWKAKMKLKLQCGTSHDVSQYNVLKAYTDCNYSN